MSVLDLPLREQAAAIASGESDAVDLLDACLARIEERNPPLNAVVDTFPERSREMLEEGGLTEPEETEELSALVAQLSGRVGRVVVDGFPTGVATAWAQHHGGPWPATTAPAHTSVGAGGLQRFVRPVCLQDAPEAVLPPALRDDNPWRVPQRVDGRLRTTTRRPAKRPR